MTMLPYSLSMDPEDEWKSYRDKRSQKTMSVSTLKGALKFQDLDQLLAGLEMCRINRVRTMNPTYVQSRRTITVIRQLEEKLNAAIESRDPAKLARIIDQVNISGAEKYLEVQLTVAKDILESMIGPPPQSFNKLSVKIKRDKLTRMLHYYRQNLLAHKVMTATLLLLGENEIDTKNWSYIQQQCLPIKLERRMSELNPDSLDERITIRAKYLLHNISLAKVQKACPLVENFYTWTRDMIGLESDDEEDEEERNEKEIQRLRAILGDKRRTLSAKEAQTLNMKIFKKEERKKRLKIDREREEKRKREEAIKCERELFPEIKKKNQKTPGSKPQGSGSYSSSDTYRGNRERFDSPELKLPTLYNDCNQHKFKTGNSSSDKKTYDYREFEETNWEEKQTYDYREIDELWDKEPWR